MADAKFKELFDFFHNPGEKTVNVHAAAPRDGKTVWIFGRGADCDFVYSTPKVSRVHCKIEYIDSHYYLTDLNSTNGTYLNGRSALSRSIPRSAAIFKTLKRFS